MAGVVCSCHFAAVYTCADYILKIRLTMVDPGPFPVSLKKTESHKADIGLRQLPLYVL